MALAGVEALDESAFERAHALAKKWNVPLLTTSSQLSGIKVVVNDAALGLAFTEVKRGKPFYCDFLTTEWRKLLRNGLPKNHIFRRALGIKAPGLKVFDATAGFGQDALFARVAGADVAAAERSSVVHAVLRDALDRAGRGDEGWRKKLEDFELFEGEAREVLNGFKKSIDVIYIDPMFDKPKKTAKSPKEMQLLQELLDPSESGEDLALFHLALKRARQRVVVKRPLKASELAPHPTHVFKGQSIRYDIYLPS